MPHSFQRILPPALFSGAFILAAVLLTGCTTDGSGSGITTSNAGNAPPPPSLVVTNDPPPEVLYRPGSRDAVAEDKKDANVIVPDDGGPVETLVSRKVAELNGELSKQQGSVGAFRDRLVSFQTKSDGLASEYYAIVASINTELQAGTTAGNPVLTSRWNEAQAKLETLSQDAGTLNQLATDIADEASKAAWLQETARATYGLSGAVAEDHKKLQTLEDGINQNLVAINRLLTSVNDEINRRAAYLRAEHLNMQTLSLAISNGELYGRNIANSLYRKADEDGAFLRGDTGASAPAHRRPLVIVRFDRANVNYEQAVYTAVSQALEKYPAAKFDLVAVSPSEGNPAQLALASTEARKNGEAVLRSLTQMGLPMERISLSAANSRDVTNSEVHLYIQ